MEVVGAVASIVGLAQAGLGLAKALNEYVGDVPDANDDIAVIAHDIYATYRQLNDLAWVLEQNETTKCMTEDAVTSAQTCAKKADVLVQKLGKLLVKGLRRMLNTSLRRVPKSVQKKPCAVSWSHGQTKLRRFA